LSHLRLSALPPYYPVRGLHNLVSARSTASTRTSCRWPGHWRHFDASQRKHINESSTEGCLPSRTRRFLHTGFEVLVQVIGNPSVYPYDLMACPSTCMFPGTTCGAKTTSVTMWWRARETRTSCRLTIPPYMMPAKAAHATSSAAPRPTKKGQRLLLLCIRAARQVTG